MTALGRGPLRLGADGYAIPVPNTVSIDRPRAGALRASRGPVGADRRGALLRSDAHRFPPLARYRSRTAEWRRAGVGVTGGASPSRSPL